jgi:indolepyruvate decarboxylase
MDCARPEGTLEPLPLGSDSAPLEAMVEAAWARLCAAENPVLWLGVLIQRFGLQDLAQRLVDASGLPFTTTSLGKTVLDEAQGQFIGTYAGPASPPATREIVEASDCLLTLGAIVTDDYLGIMKSSYGDMIAANDEEARSGFARYDGVYFGNLMTALVERFEASAEWPRPWKPLPPPAPEPDPAPEGGLTYNRFYGRLTGFLDREGMTGDTVLVLGESTSLYVFGNLFGRPRDSFVAQAAWGSLGHETGCALGVALASGKRPFVVAGDGGFMMICQEISSLVRAGVGAAIFVMSNKGYAIEQAFVNLEAFEPGGEFAPFDVLPSWDYLALAQAFGAKGMRVETEDALEAALAEIKDLTGTTVLVEVVISPNDLAPQLKRLAKPPAAQRKYYRTPMPE